MSVPLSFHETRNCLHCGKEFVARVRRDRPTYGRYCGKSCSRSARSLPWPDRFWEKVDKNGPIPDHRPELGQCWVWQGSTNKDGYGRTWTPERQKGAHRASYELMIGPIPGDLDLDHLCRNRSCVNPTHLEPVTTRENILRGAHVGAIRLRTGYCLRGHRFDGDNVYVAPDGTRACRECTRENHQQWKADNLEMYRAYRAYINARQRARTSRRRLVEAGNQMDVNSDERLAQTLYTTCLDWISRTTSMHERDEPWSWEELTDDERDYWRSAALDVLASQVA